MTGPSTRDGAGDEYVFEAAGAHNHSFLIPGVLGVLGPASGRRVIDLGCGNGALTHALSEHGFDAVGVDASTSGMALARQNFGQTSFVQHDLENPLPADLQKSFDVVIAAEVIEHLFLPRSLFTRASEALTPGGILVLTTPFHGYWKNLAIALTNGYDKHWRPGWDHGHIKFFSKKTLTSMTTECGFEPLAWKMVGRAPWLAKSMIMQARAKR